MVQVSGRVFWVEFKWINERPEDAIVAKVQVQIPGGRPNKSLYCRQKKSWAQQVGM